jgi:hypothetical protein
VPHHGDPACPLPSWEKSSAASPVAPCQPAAITKTTPVLNAQAGSGDTSSSISLGRQEKAALRSLASWLEEHASDLYCSGSDSIDDSMLGINSATPFNMDLRYSSNKFVKVLQQMSRSNSVLVRCGWCVCVQLQCADALCTAYLSLVPVVWSAVCARKNYDQVTPIRYITLTVMSSKESLQLSVHTQLSIQGRHHD